MAVAPPSRDGVILNLYIGGVGFGGIVSNRAC